MVYVISIIINSPLDFVAYMSASESKEPSIN
jgi:hypothetical protein